MSSSPCGMCSSAGGWSAIRSIPSFTGTPCYKTSGDWTYLHTYGEWTLVQPCATFGTGHQPPFLATPDSCAEFRDLPPCLSQMDHRLLPEMSRKPAKHQPRTKDKRESTTVTSHGWLQPDKQPSMKWQMSTLVSGITTVDDGSPKPRESLLTKKEITLRNCPIV